MNSTKIEWSNTVAESRRRGAGKRAHNGRPKHKRTCEICGTEWYTTRAKLEYCSDECYDKHLKRKQRR